MDKNNKMSDDSSNTGGKRKLCTPNWYHKSNAFQGNNAAGISKLEICSSSDVGKMDADGIIDDLTLVDNDESLLLQFEIDINVFKHLMESTEAILSGSIVLQCFIGARWDDSDVDIYLPYLGKTQRNKTVFRP